MDYEKSEEVFCLKDKNMYSSSKIYQRDYYQIHLSI